MEFRLLGPLEVTEGDHSLTPTAPKVREVLALLLIRHNQVVRVDDLIEELWGERPPASALTTLQTYIYKLRKIFESCGKNPESILSTRPSGYLLAVPGDDVDVVRFEQLVDAGRQALASDAARATE